MATELPRSSCSHAVGCVLHLHQVGVETIPPVTLIAARTLIAGGILLAVMRLRGSPAADAATWRRFLVQACLNSVVPFTLIAWAETERSMPGWRPS